MKSSATNLKISWFKREHDQELLDLSPDFQRNPIWSEDEASYLIDSILSGIPVPEIYSRSKTSPEGETVHEIVDGQQRLTSILRFASDDLELTGEDVSPRWRGKRLSDLSDAEKASFWSYSLVTRDLEGASDTEVRDVFRRLNLVSKELNDQELRHARYRGQFISLVEDIAEDEWWIDNKVVNVRQIRRMIDAEFISELLIGLMAGPQDKKLTLDDFYADYESEFPDKEKWARAFRRTRDLVDATLEGRLKGWTSKTEFYGLFLALGQLALEGRKLKPEEREAIATALERFRNKVDGAKKRDADPERFSEDVRAYAQAATRATTDVSRRTTRVSTLEKIIRAALGKKADGSVKKKSKRKTSDGGKTGKKG
ncbi:MAG TPA: hypothetical protein DEA08_10310 [Planctomycetes bacterium]|nr:hypothetical protein [Planctomycetota bacterium]|tara:strand:+ start:1368 stop:2477 length:1110 start_codon:yes stop_codon:yes gene_type:complete